MKIEMVEVFGKWEPLEGLTAFLVHNDDAKKARICVDDKVYDVVCVADNVPSFIANPAQVKKWVNVKRVLKFWKW